MLRGRISRSLSRTFSRFDVVARQQGPRFDVDKHKVPEFGQRDGKPVILVVDYDRMHADGYSFYHADNGVWLGDAVPVSNFALTENDVAGGDGK